MMASEERRVDGRHLTTQAGELLNKISEELTRLADRLDASRVQEWQETIQSLVKDIPTIQERLFLKTQGGTDWAREALEKVQELEKLLEKVPSLTPAEATQAVDEAVSEVKRVLGGLIEKARTLIIRMT
jgi:hypothetical protein